MAAAVAATALDDWSKSEERSAAAFDVPSEYDVWLVFTYASIGGGRRSDENPEIAFDRL